MFGNLGKNMESKMKKSNQLSYISKISVGNTLVLVPYVWFFDELVLVFIYFWHKLILVFYFCSIVQFDFLFFKSNFLTLHFYLIVQFEFSPYNLICMCIIILLMNWVLDYILFVLSQMKRPYFTYHRIYVG